MGMIEINWNPERRTLRQFGLIGIAVFGGLGAFTAWRHGIDWKPIVLWGLAAFCGIAALTAPRLLRPLFVGMSVAAAPIGFVVSHVILAIVYFGIFTPIALAMRLAGRDAMQRRYDRSAKTYWTERPRETKSERYFRQY
jgi:saxitoxin biosynthesis operon SxtJ-like protein